MKKNPHSQKKIKKICNIILIILLVSGILTSTLGVFGVVNKAEKKNPNIAPSTTQITNDQNQENEEKPFSPVDEYGDLPNEIELNDDVVIMEDQDSQVFCDSIIDVDTDGYYGGRTTFTLLGEDNSSVDDLSRGDFVYIQGDEDSYITSDRLYKIDSISNRDGNTIVSVTQPYFEDVFESMEVSFSDLLTEDNFVKAYYAEGVTSRFGDVDSAFKTVANTSYSNVEVSTLNYSSSGTSYTNALNPSSSTKSVSEKPQATTLATDYSAKGGELIVEFDYDFSKKKDGDKEKDDKPIDASFGIKGSFGAKDLTAHIISDIPSIANPRELYLGVSGKIVANIEPYGKISTSSNVEGNKKDLRFATLEGISEKRFPLAVFQFKGTTPMYITNSAFNNNEKIFPSLYLVFYADWKGNIAFELNGGFEYTNSFNSGLRIIDNGEFTCSLENYPYYDGGEATSDGMNWFIDLSLDADTELTFFGSSLLFYIGGINVGEFSIARLGTEAECNLHLKASTKDGLKILNNDDTNFYIRGFLKFVEAKVKLKANGKGILSKLDVDVNFEFSLLDFTLFEAGNQPDKYKPKIHVSSIKPPDEFESIITLVLDVSGSMGDRIATNQTKLEAAKEAAEKIVDVTENWSEKYEGNYGMGLVQFASDAETISVPHIDYPFLRNSIGTMGDGGGTTIYKGIDLGVSQLKDNTATTKVIILMTDGQDSNHSDALESAKKAAKEDIKIYTIGFGSDADEEILKQIAEVTGGEYRYASTDNIVGIMGSFIYAQQSANSNVLAEYEGAVSEGETSEKTTFDVDSMSGDLIATTVWPGSFLDTIVTDPNGRVVDEKYPGAIIDESGIPSTLTVKNPIKGSWKVEVKGIETSYDKEPFYTVVSFKEIEKRIELEEISSLENLSAHCIPIGIYVSVISLLLLLCINTKKKTEK